MHIAPVGINAFVKLVPYIPFEAKLVEILPAKERESEKRECTILVEKDSVVKKAILLTRMLSIQMVESRMLKAARRLKVKEQQLSVMVYNMKFKATAKTAVVVCCL